MFVFQEHLKNEQLSLTPESQYRVLLNGADFVGHIPEACVAYRHYRSGSGEPLTINYERFYMQDAAGHAAIDYQVLRAQSMAQWLRKELGKNSFSMTGSEFPVVVSTQNWQKTLGSHVVWGSADVAFDPSTSMYKMTLTLHAEDYYNFNKGEHDIATGRNWCQFILFLRNNMN